MDISSFYNLSIINEVANLKAIKNKISSNIKNTTGDKIIKESEFPLGNKEFKAFSLNSSIKFLNSNFIQAKEEVRTYINDSSPSKEIVSQPFMSPIYDHPIFNSKNSSQAKSLNNFKSNSILSNPELEVEDSNAVCNFRLSEISDDDLESKILKKHELCRTNQLPKDKYKDWNCDLTFSSKRTQGHKVIPGKIFNNFEQNKDYINPSIIFPNLKFNNEKRKNRKKEKKNKTYKLEEKKLINVIKQNQIKTKSKKTRCTCERSKCIKKYCECYANGEGCNKDTCKCVNCQNIYINDNNVVIYINESDNENNDLNNINKDSVAKNEFSLLNKKRDLKDKNSSAFCNCTKSKCNKQYCECFKNNKTCNGLCRCLKCNNKEKLKNPHEHNVPRQSFEHISISIINNNLNISNFIEEIPIVSKKNKTKKKKHFFKVNECKSPFGKKLRLPLFTTTCESTVSRKISNREDIFEKMSSKHGRNVKRKIEMKKFSNQNFYDLNPNENSNAEK